MKNLIYLLVITLFLIGCGSTKTSTHKNSDGYMSDSELISPDELKWTDRGFKRYLDVKKLDAHPFLINSKHVDRYPLSYYRTENLLSVKKWNSMHPTKRIDYHENDKNDLNTNYELYQYFKYLEYKQSKEPN